MRQYPIYVRRAGYRGSQERLLRKARRHNELAALLEKHINQKFDAQPENIQCYSSALIAIELGLDVREVTDLLYSVDCGSNGFTIFRYPEGDPRIQQRLDAAAAEAAKSPPRPTPKCASCGGTVRGAGPHYDIVCVTCGRNWEPALVPTSE